MSKFISGLLLKRIVEKYNIDLIHANSEAAGIVAVKTRNKYKLDIPIVYTAHGVLPAKVKDTDKNTIQEAIHADRRAQNSTDAHA